jgi:hypothetical protein
LAGVAAAGGAEAERKLELLGIAALVQVLRRGECGGIQREAGGEVPGAAGQVRDNCFRGLLQGEGAGDGDHGVPAEMLEVAEAGEGAAVDAGDALLRPGDRVAHRMRRPERGRNQVADVVRRAFAVHHDFLADHLAFEADLRFGKHRVPDQVG